MFDLQGGKNFHELQEGTDPVEVSEFPCERGCQVPRESQEAWAGTGAEEGGWTNTATDCQYSCPCINACHRPKNQILLHRKSHLPHDE